MVTKKSKAQPSVGNEDSPTSHNGRRISKKKTLHPNYRRIAVEMTDGSVFDIYSTYHQNVIKLDVDIKTHPAWTKETNYINSRASEVSKFQQRYSGLDFLTAKKS
ncbi:50S ribosomal protein L31 [Rickettsiales endosymbiont of Peranema trichophorum]|uniref:50S ribosomal protein L31 n=1 Tax=Rickettsiales endosymbiont of Peranema trichophorum TaxID=2486577 RepID=UPI001022CA4A|nr:50S ribosomal protein L31 [Rickettsiales endosymbiont of Peranema trichophorum]RZI47305.1 50S ribosomal protein L31 [Rickettsiales endosymbiont of Peranema trichophorum]